MTGADPGFRFEPRLSLITLGVRNLSRSIRFYESLGWERSAAGGPEIGFFQLGGIVLAIWSLDELALDAAVDPSGDGFRGISIAYNVRDAAEVDRALSAAEAAGASITRPAEDAVWGGRTGYFADPDGHLWEVAWNPGFPIDERGGVHLPGAAQRPE